ncbi:mechanosensitive ion channel family protein [Nannocystis pusilla]|uniref:Mechanosensitive ion channel family protein n=1 Tax=Nannocystis pusilla TaxID=889268 RepID=A0ABS7U0H9_9BACT|nr:mechanosensitive ion channel family protein [Nannocystis pusilla]MBZ5714023.1 mechanosensitive ion channel family protein [Nannocystis pusilla]
MPQALLELLEVPPVRAAAVLLGAFLGAFLVELFFRGVVQILVRKTKTDLDDQIVAILRRPVFITVLLVGFHWSAGILDGEGRFGHIGDAALETIAVIVWTRAAFRIATLLLHHFSRRAGDGAFLQPRTLPLFDMFAKLLLVGGATYFALLAWKVDVTGWLASAGIVGIAVGFAAKDSLANLFAGIFILADAPYKIGDMIKFDDGLRGRVTDIGLRSTRILTRDNIEINVPNSIIGNSKVVNESAGPTEKERVSVKVSVAIGSDIDLVRAVLLECPKGQPHICDEPAPTVVFTSFGRSGLELSLLVWIHQPGLLEEVLDNLNCRVYKALTAANIEIPYSKHDVYIKGLPEPFPLPAPEPRPSLALGPPRPLLAPEPVSPG